MTDPHPEDMREAEEVVSGWELAEGESLRDGHRYTFVRLIASALSSLRKERDEALAALHCQDCKDYRINAESRLPEGMKHCTILFKECERGHGRLTATNWIDHGCEHCALEAAESRLREAEERERGLRRWMCPKCGSYAVVYDRGVNWCSCGTKWRPEGPPAERKEEA